MPHVTLISPDGQSTARVSSFGARVLSWVHHGKEHLFLPEVAAQDEAAASHGGIPVLFPQFGFFGNGRKHGIVRDAEWILHASSATTVMYQFIQRGSKDLFDFDAALTVELQDNHITIGLQVTNGGTEPVTFTAGLHTYFRVRDIEDTTLTGLENTSFLDALQDLKEIPGARMPLRRPIDVDRVFTNTPHTLNLDTGDSQLEITQTGFTDTVVWNPGAARAASLKDLAADDWRHFLCIEPAEISTPKTLAASQTWRATQTLKAT